MKKPLPARLTPLAVLSLTLLAGCIYVRVKGDLSEAAWLDEVIHDNHAAPASFHHGDAEFELEGFLWSHEGRLEVDFSCEPDELDAYAQSVRQRVEQKIEDEGYSVVSLREIGEREWEYEYVEDHDRGRVTIEIVERSAGKGYPYRLELRWTEN